MPSSRPKPVCHHSIYSGVYPTDVLLLVSATLNLLSLYHDTILARRATSRPVIPPSAHSKYTHAWADRSPQYKWVARALEIIKYLELVFEMTLRRGFRATQKTIWRAIICLEFVKWVSGSIQPSSSNTSIFQSSSTVRYPQVNAPTHSLATNPRTGNRPCRTPVPNCTLIERIWIVGSRSPP